ncbi:MAG: hypothetical protein IPK69_03150 [Phycisphaerales bacterium]|nr:MAG: hypothetical protein IPK69_03150 [Phycisphaerales bacterium]
MTWFSKTRLKVLTYVVGILLAALGVLSMTALPAWVVLAPIVAAVAMVINTTASRLASPTCLHCGHDVKDTPHGHYGAICPECGSLAFSGRNDDAARAGTSDILEDAGDDVSDDTVA